MRFHLAHGIAKSHKRSIGYQPEPEFKCKIFCRFQLDTHTIFVLSVDYLYPRESTIAQNKYINIPLKVSPTTS